MTEIIIYAVLGLGGLLAGGSILIPGVVSLARQMGLPAVAVTVIVIAGGTSTPELIVSVDAALVGSPGIVWGNLIGSNIANIALVLGLGMLVQPVTADVNQQPPTDRAAPCHAADWGDLPDWRNDRSEQISLQ